MKAYKTSVTSRELYIIIVAILLSTFFGYFGTMISIERNEEIASKLKQIEVSHKEDPCVKPRLYINGNLVLEFGNNACLFSPGILYGEYNGVHWRLQIDQVLKNAKSLTFEYLERPGINIFNEDYPCYDRSECFIPQRPGSMISYTYVDGGLYPYNIDIYTDMFKIIFVELIFNKGIANGVVIKDSVYGIEYMMEKE